MTPDVTTPPAATQGHSLGKATIVAVIVAVVVLVVAVLPAEYGMDPLGTGDALGLTALYEAGAGLGGPAPAVITADPSGPLVPPGVCANTLTLLVTPSRVTGMRQIWQARVRAT